MHSGYTPPRLRMTLIAIVTALVLVAACSSGGGAAIIPVKAAPTTTVVPMTTTTTNPATTTTDPALSDSAIIAADQDAVAAFNAAGSSNPVQPGYPALAMYVAGKQLATDRELLTELVITHEHYVGTYTQTNYVVAQLIGDQAVVLSCAIDDTADASNTSGTIETPSPHSRNLVNDLLEFMSGRWVVTDEGVRSPTC